MFSRKSMSLIAVLGLLIFSVYAAAGPNANGILSLDLIADGGAGNRTDDGITSGTVSGQGTTIAIEVFATGVRTSLIDMAVKFDFDSSLLSFVKAENSAFPLTLPEGSIGTHFAPDTRNPVALASSGFLARAEFATVSDVTGTEFSIGIESVTLAESTTSIDELTTTSVITFNASPSPDFNGDNWVGFTDFLIFGQVFGSQQGDGTYDARMDLNSDGSIGFTDFLIFAQNFGKEVPSPVVAIPDANLRAAIQAALDKAGGAPITQAEMATLNSLEANDADIGDLTGLESAANLTYLSLNDNDITDISPLASLSKLTRLWLSNNSIEDISSLSKLANLTELWLWNNQIEDISALSGLTNLRRLSLGRNNITDISALAGLTNLNTLILRSNRISDLTPLAANTGLRAGGTVDVTDNPLNATSYSTHIPALQARGIGVSVDVLVTIPDAGLRAAIEATLGKATGVSITQPDMATLFSLKANTRGISDLTGLEYATALTRLNLASNNITDISALAGLTSLTNLILSTNNIFDLASLVANTGLGRGATVDVADNPLNDASQRTHIPALRARGVSVTYVPSPIVAIPDANLRSAIEAALGKTSGAPITAAEVRTLTAWLDLQGLDIDNLTGLEFAINVKALWLNNNRTGFTDLSVLSGLTNLVSLGLNGNRITDVSALSGLANLENLSLSSNDLTDVSALSSLTKLRFLTLGDNDLTDVSALSGLTNLWTLWLNGNRIADISTLADLTNLETLWLDGNNLMNISALSGLTKLKSLDLNGNRITDVSVLSGFANLNELGLGVTDITDISALMNLVHLTRLELRGTPLNVSSINDHIPALERRGVTVLFDASLRPGDFDIELIFLDSFTEAQKRVIQYAARRWMSTITDDLPDYEFAGGWSSSCAGRSMEISPGERIDDLRIYVITNEGRWATVNLLREESSLPVVGCMSVGGSGFDTEIHEIAHVLGFGAIWYNLGFLQDPNGDAHFNGPLATAAFDDAGGRVYTGAKVPVQKMDWAHWRLPVVGGEIMGGGQTPRGTRPLSAITIQSMADLGYGVDVTKADPYTLPSAAGKASAKIVAAMAPTAGRDVTRANAYTLPGVDPHWQGRIADLPLISGDDRGTGRPGSPEWIGGHPFDLRSDRQVGHLARSRRAVPELLCGAGFHRGPIYVVDPQGRIVRTLGD